MAVPWSVWGALEGALLSRAVLERCERGGSAVGLRRFETWYGVVVRDARFVPESGPVSQPTKVK